MILKERSGLYYNFFADLVVGIHFLFVLYVVLGGLIVFWKLRSAWLHIPAVLWATCIEFTGWICPLTPLEGILREKGGGAGYNTGFIEHYIVPVLYPASLTRNTQILLGIMVAGLNIGIYVIVWMRMRRARKG